MATRRSLRNLKTEELTEPEGALPQTAGTSTEEGEESEYEEEIMVIELNGVLDAESVRQAARNGLITLRRANGSEPLVQVGSAIYTGQWAQTMGTDLIFCTSDKVVREGGNDLHSVPSATAPLFPTNISEEINFGSGAPVLEMVAVVQTRLVAHKAVFSSTATTQPRAQVGLSGLAEAVEDMIDVEVSQPNNTPKKRQKSK